MAFNADIRISQVDSTNSSTTNLTTGTSLIFTGTWFDISEYGSLSVLVDGTSSGTVGGTLEIQLSHDASTVHRNITVPSVDITNILPRTLGAVAQYYRVQFTADSDLLSFDIQSMVHEGQVDLVSRLDQTLQGDEDVQLVRDPSDFNLDAARQHIAGQRAFFFFGFNAAVGTGWEDIHPGGGDINWQTAATTVEVLSSDAADTSAGLGVRSVEIHGLSATGVDQDEVITMNGVTPVSSSLTYTRINKMHSETCGTYGGSHQGDITCRVVSAGATLSIMKGSEGAVDTSVQYGSGEAGNGYWSVPLGKVMYITGIELITDVSGTKTVDVALYEREDILTTSAPFAPRRIIWEATDIDSNIDKSFKSHIKIKSLTDLWFRAKGSATSKLEVFLEFYLVDADVDGA